MNIHVKPAISVLFEDPMGRFGGITAREDFDWYESAGKACVNGTNNGNIITETSSLQYYQNTGLESKNRIPFRVRGNPGTC